MLDRSDQTTKTPDAAPNPHQDAPPAQTTIETPPPTQKSSETKPDPITARLMADLGAVIDKDGQVQHVDPTKAPEKPAQAMSHQFVTLGEANRWKAERKELADAEAKAAAEKPPEKKEGAPPPDPNAAKPAEKKEGEAATPPADKPPVKKTVAVEVAEPLEKVVEKAVERRLRETKPVEAEPAKQPDTKGDPDADFVATLPEAMQEEIELATRAEKDMPDKYKGARAKAIESVRKIDAHIAKKRAEDPEWNPDADPEYDEFLEENTFKIARKDRRTIESSIIEERAEARVMAKLQPQIEETQRVARANELKPAIEQTLQSFDTMVKSAMVPDEKAPLAAKDDKLAESIQQKFTEQAKHLAKLYLDISMDVVKVPDFDPDLDLNHPDNKLAMEASALNRFLIQQEEQFLRNGGDLRFRQGRKFVPRAIYAQIPPNEKAQYWTTGHEEALEMIAFTSANTAQNAYVSEKERREKDGYVRSGPAPQPKVEDKNGKPKPREESPRAVSSSSPGLAQSTPPPPVPVGMTKEEIDRQLSNGVKRWN